MKIELNSFLGAVLVVLVPLLLAVGCGEKEEGDLPEVIVVITASTATLVGKRVVSTQHQLAVQCLFDSERHRREKERQTYDLEKPGHGAPAACFA